MFHVISLIRFTRSHHERITISLECVRGEHGLLRSLSKLQLSSGTSLVL